MIIAAAKRGKYLRQDAQRRPIKPHLPECGTHQRADEHNILAALNGGKTDKVAKLPDRTPLMRIAHHSRGIRHAAQGEEDDPASALDHRIGHGKRKSAAAADDRQRSVGRVRRGGRAHASSSLSWRRTAMVSGRLPALMNAITFCTNASLAKSAATASRRARNSPTPKNKV